MGEVLKGSLLHLLHLAPDHLEFGQGPHLLAQGGAEIVWNYEILNLILDDTQRPQGGLAVVEDVAPVLFAELWLPSAEGLEVELDLVERHIEMVEGVVDDGEVALEGDSRGEGAVGEGVGKDEGGPVVDHRLELDLLPVVLGRPVHQPLHEGPHRGGV